MKDDVKIMMCDARQRVKLKYKNTLDKNKEKHFTR